MRTYLGSTDVSHRFAAMGATSGPLMAKEDTGSQKVPMLHTMAEYDMWSYDLSLDSSMVISAANMWLTRNGLATAENVDAVRRAGYAATATSGRWNYCDWKNAQGIPMYEYIWVTGKDHVNMPAENELLWNTFFKFWTVDIPTGVRYFKGIAVQ